jgi:L-seryl-tRNA(Ser) seleniumtransferase
MDDERQAALRRLPAVSRLLSDTDVQIAAVGLREDVVTAVVRRVQERARRAILAGDIAAGDRLTNQVGVELRMLGSGASGRVINATGVILHTNLGRAPVSAHAAAAMEEAAANYLPLEMDLETGERGGRGREVELLLCALTGAERALVVNNNAAAVMLVLAAVAVGRSVIVSRGEAVEIGGGFRVPDVLRQSGARLVEVGTTNRTYVRDYESAIDDSTAAILRVHASNFLIVGFTTQPSVGEVAKLAHAHGILALEDVGSGCLLDTTRYGLSAEPQLGDSIAAGVDLVMASGDKLLGGPQAGLIIGSAAAVERVVRHPLARALRADKTALAGLATTLRHYVRGEAEEHIPVWWSISREPGFLRGRVEHWIGALGTGMLRETEAVVGGGAMPGRTMPSFGLALHGARLPPAELAKRLRLGEPAIIARVGADEVILDARTVLADQDNDLVSAAKAALGG